MFKKIGSIVFVLIIALSAAVPVYASAVTTASKVYGQGGSFTTNTANNGGISANSLDIPAGGVFDKNGNLYVADQYNNRVLYYPAGSTTATRVYGQGGSFTTNTANKGGVSAKAFIEPYDVALDGSGNLYVSDCGNNRVLYYPAGNTTATRVYGQGGSFTTNTVNKGGISAKSLYCPAGVAVDKNGNLYISDVDNSRVLYYPSGSTTATRVYGQGGSFTTNTANKGGVSAHSLYYPGINHPGQVTATCMSLIIIIIGCCITLPAVPPRQECTGRAAVSQPTPQIKAASAPRAFTIHGVLLWTGAATCM